MVYPINASRLAPSLWTSFWCPIKWASQCFCWTEGCFCLVRPQCCEEGVSLHALLWRLQATCAECTPGSGISSYITKSRDRTKPRRSQVKVQLELVGDSKRPGWGQRNGRGFEGLGSFWRKLRKKSHFWNQVFLGDMSRLLFPCLGDKEDTFASSEIKSLLRVITALWSEWQPGGTVKVTVSMGLLVT